MKKRKDITISKYILGINGLGVSPSAALLRDGELLAMAEEERFNRIKGSFGIMPSKAAAWVLNTEGLNLSDVTCIAFGWNAPFYRLGMPLFLLKTALSRAPMSIFNSTGATSELMKYQPSNIRRLLIEMFRSEGFRGALPPVHFVSHHSAHAALAFYTSPFERSGIIVVDGSGENKTTTAYIGTEDKIKEIFTYRIPDSIGWFYKAVTEYLGFLPDRHEGKVMALASYGEVDQKLREDLCKILFTKKSGRYAHDATYTYLGPRGNGKVFSTKMEKLLGPPRFRGEEITQRHKNIARAAQSILEDTLLNITDKLFSIEDSSSNLCLAGGVALNCRMNGRISEHKSVENIYLPPVPGDAGTALGAALSVSSKYRFNVRRPMKNSYWGPGFSNEEVEDVLKKCKADYKRVEDSSSYAAELLSSGNIIGWFQGRLESGPRALGGRSILADPRDIRMKDLVNERVKGREKWRPFAPSIIKEHAGEYLKDPFDSLFMGIAFRTTGLAEKKIPAAIHIDETTRPQIVIKEHSEKYWNLINSFGKKTGVYALLNTSFNTDEEPIVRTPEEALRSFHASGLDYLVIEDFVVRKGGK